MIHFGIDEVSEPFLASFIELVSTKARTQKLLDPLLQNYDNNQMPVLVVLKAE